MIVFHNISQLMSLKGAVQKQGRKILKKDLSLIKKAAIVVKENHIQWVGPESKLPEAYKKSKKKSLEGLKVYPGFVDCHTHLVFAGDRKNEFEMRNQGSSYQEIAKKGGGILATVRATRKAGLRQLIDSGQKRVMGHLKQGVTTIEVKSGYGLNQKTEEKILEAAKSLKKANIITTFLGAHAIPREFKNENLYLKKLKKDLLRIKKLNLGNRVDIFIEKGYFSYQSAKDYLLYAKNMDFDLCIHADQLSRSKATTLAVELEAKSADHVICLNQRDKQRLADSETVAVLLPCADFYLQCPYPDARTLIDGGACVALATDFNPGSSPTQNMGLLGLLARLQMKMSLPEVFVATTFGGAKALGLENKVGALLPGYQADFFTSPSSWENFFYNLSPLPVSATFIKGKKIDT